MLKRDLMLNLNSQFISSLMRISLGLKKVKIQSVLIGFLHCMNLNFKNKTRISLGDLFHRADGFACIAVLNQSTRTDLGHSVEK